MVAPNQDSVEYDIILKAAQAMQELQALTAQASTFNEKINLVSATLKRFSTETGLSMKSTVSLFKDADDAFTALNDKSAMFGQLGKQGWTEVNQSVKTFGNESKSAFERAVTGINGFRIALGAIISMLLFQGIQAVTQFFKTAIDNAQQLEASLYRIHNAERILSGEGIQVSTKGLEDGIKRIKALLPIFSKEDIAGLVGQVAITTKSLGLTEKQIVDLSQAIAILNVNSAEDETLQATAQHVISSLLTSNAKGVANLGLKLGDAAIQAKALEMGLLDAGESVTKLTDHEKAIVKVQIAIDGAGQSVAGLNEFMETNTAKIQKNKAAWNDLLTTVGQLILPFVPAVTALFSALTDVVNYFKTAVATVGTVLTAVLTIIRMFASGGIKSFGQLRDAIRSVVEEARKLVFRQLFPEGVPDNAPEWFKKLAGNLAPAETPTTGTVDTSGTEQQNQSNIQKAVKEGQDKLKEILKDSADKKLDIERDYQRKLDDINTNYSQKLEDITRNTAQKREDALRNLNQKVEDINRDAAEKIAQANQEARQKELDREAEFQQKLKELRDKFLFDLEDALRERDARQVLRLIRQYNMDKQNLEDRHKLDRVQAKKDLATKLQDIEYERQKKLEAAQREYAQKLEDIKIAEARERAEAKLNMQRQLEDARIWHQRQLQEQQQYLQRKLRDLADALKAEYNLTAQGMQAINSLLASGYNLPTGMTANTSNGAVVGGSYSSPSAGWAAQAQTFVNAGLYGTGMAEGGTLIATRPTKALFGENGPERVDVTPLDKVGNNLGKTYGDRSAMGMSGNVKIALELSPDLEARIIDSSLDGVAVHLEQMVRSKA